jgi:chromosome segregation ATPase
MLKEIQRRKLFQQEFNKLLVNYDLNRIIEEENERRKLNENALFPHQCISGFSNKIPTIDYSKFNVDIELPNIEDQINENWMVMPLTESIANQENGKQISDSFYLSSFSSTLNFGSSFLEGSYNVNIESNEKVEESPEALVDESSIQKEETIMEEQLKEITPLKDEVPDFQQFQVEELIKKNQELEEQIHVLQKNSNKISNKLNKSQQDKEILVKDLKQKETVNSILEKEIKEKSNNNQELKKELKLKSEESIKCNSKIEKLKSLNLDLKKKLEANEKFINEAVSVNDQKTKEVEVIQQKLEELNSLKITIKNEEIVKKKQKEEIEKLTKELSKSFEKHDEERTGFGIELSKNQSEMDSLRKEVEFFKLKLKETTRDLVNEVSKFEMYKSESEKKIQELKKFIAHTTDMLQIYANKNK